MNRWLSLVMGDSKTIKDCNKALAIEFLIVAITAFSAMVLSLRLYYYGVNPVLNLGIGAFFGLVSILKVLQFWTTYGSEHIDLPVL